MGDGAGGGPVVVEVADRVAVVTIDRPPVNALDREVRRQLIATFDELGDRSDVRVAILTGAGRVFCAGSDLAGRPDPDLPGDFGDYNRLVRETANAIRECTKPVIAAINGPALGAGVAVAAACDIMVASTSACFGMPEIDVGLAGGAALLLELFGRSRTRRMLYTGLRVPAEELYRLGVVEAAVEPDALMAEAGALAAEIAGKSPRGIRYAKQSVTLAELMPPRDAYRFEQGLTVELARSVDGREARQAFLDKRQPNFTEP